MVVYVHLPLFGWGKPSGRAVVAGWHDRLLGVLDSAVNSSTCSNDRAISHIGLAGKHYAKRSLIPLASHPLNAHMDFVVPHLRHSFATAALSALKVMPDRGPFNRPPAWNLT
jgi:hypothetical protein